MSDQIQLKRGEDAFYLSVGGATEPARIDAPAGRPTHVRVTIGGKVKRLPVSYWRKDAIGPGKYVHPRTGQSLDMSVERIDGMVATNRAMLAAGRTIPLPAGHTDDPARSHGKVIEVGKNGDRLSLVTQVVGKRGAKLVAANECSLCIDPSYVDEFGKTWADAITHCAITPVPVITGMGGFEPVPFAASRDGTPATPLYILSAAPAEKGPQVDYPQLREALGAAADVPDDQLIDAVRKLRGDVVSLSRTPDPDALAQKAEVTNDHVDLLQERGDITPAMATGIKALALANGKPNAFMLSRAPATGTVPIDAVLALFRGAKLAPASGRAADPVRLSRETPGGDEDKERKEAEDAAFKQGRAYRDEQLAARGITA